MCWERLGQTDYILSVCLFEFSPRLVLISFHFLSTPPSSFLDRWLLPNSPHPTCKIAVHRTKLSCKGSMQIQYIMLQIYKFIGGMTKFLFQMEVASNYVNKLYNSIWIFRPSDNMIGGVYCKRENFHMGIFFMFFRAFVFFSKIMVPPSKNIIHMPLWRKWECVVSWKLPAREMSCQHFRKILHISILV